jgi:5-methyltetrahydrofolate--homocysteine methyltransferase
VPEAIHRAYFEAGADIAETNTFSANRISQADYGAEHLVREINVESARWPAAWPMNSPPPMAVRASSPARSGRPTRRSRSPDVNDPGYREIDWDFLVEVYREQAEALVEGGADFILVETVFDTLNCKAAIMAVKSWSGNWAAKCRSCCR